MLVIYEGQLDSLKRFKDDVKEVKSNFECGLSIKNFDDLKVNDKLEAYEHVQVARKLYKCLKTILEVIVSASR